ncbi:hypothetical protein EVAR_70606_1, partial [Eumeta japonica]
CRNIERGTRARQRAAAGPAGAGAAPARAHSLCIQRAL